MNKKLENEVKEVKKFRELDSYEEYKTNGNQGTRHLVEPNGFKKKVIVIIGASQVTRMVWYKNSYSSYIILHSVRIINTKVMT